MNRFSKLCALCAALMMSITAFADEVTNYPSPEWNEYEFTIDDPEGVWTYTTNRYVSTNIPAGTTRTLKFTFTNDEDATFIFKHLREGGVNATTHRFDCAITVDGEPYITYNNFDFQNENCRKFIELTPGTHCISFNVSSASSSSGSDIDFTEFGIMKTTTVSVNLLEPGSLGGEVLYNVDKLQDVRKLKIKGEMNDVDWEKITMMKDIFVLDLSEAVIKEIPERQFYYYYNFLHTVNLPEGLLSIGSDAFRSSPLANINFPSSLTTIGSQAFCDCCLREAIMHNGCINWGTTIFARCCNLRKASLPDDLSNIPFNSFANCTNLNEISLPNGITQIGSTAFSNCYYLHPDLPESLTTLGEQAFVNTNKYGDTKSDLVIPHKVSNISKWAWSGTQYTYAIMPPSMAFLTGIDFLPDGIKTIRMESPTVVDAHREYDLHIVNNNYRSGITIQVPDFLVNSYKLDSYWYNFGKIEGFSPEEISEWVIQSDLTLGARDRLLGTPSIDIKSGGSLKINGTDGMPINNLYVGCNPDNKAYGQIFSNAEGVTVANNLQMNFRAGTKNRWYYLCLPYNVKVGDMVFTNNNPKRAIRYYDGAHRADQGTGGNWKNYEADDIIPAGTGFIFSVSEDGWWNFPSLDDESKQNITSTQMFVKDLAENPSATASNRGWNLVGNPYQCWYNIHKLNFTAPITVRNSSYNGYAAYSIIDDDYALAPNQAFFVQCPEGTSQISFPLNGRQMTSEITDQNGVRPRYAKPSERRLADVTLSADGMSDRTRVVLNESASMEYEVECDASKFMNDAGVAQLYTLDNEGTMYAINERPIAEGMVSMGMSIPAAGIYTLSLTRNTAGNVYVVDNLTGEMVKLSSTDYSFYSEAGINVERFCLKFTTATGIDAVPDNTTQASGVYSLAGAYMGHSIKGLPAGSYIIKSGAKVNKVVIR